MSIARGGEAGGDCRGVGADDAQGVDAVGAQRQEDADAVGAGGVRLVDDRVDAGLLERHGCGGSGYAAADDQCLHVG
ncbi:hypothetical protein [Streptomyces sp. NBC_01518]|uniref:hypothetical protein n=1 Tax=Streptomyces sp. NBC_01518 TaxID=2903891 RepID=UPI00386F630F